MSKVQYHKLLVAMPILMFAVGTAQAAPKTLNAVSSTINISYTLPTTANPTAATTVITATDAGTFFYIDPTTVPGWLTATANGTAGATVATGATVSFKANAAAATLAPGTYSATVTYYSTATGSPTCAILVILSVKAPGAIFTPAAAVTGGSVNAQAVSLAWSQGAAYPTVSISGTSSNEPIAYGITFGGNIAGSMAVDFPGGVAYTWGSAASTVTFKPAVFLQAAVGASLTGTIVVTPTISGVAGTPTTYNVTITIGAAVATFSSVTPGELPVQATGSASVQLNGTGFVTGSTAVQVKIAAGSFVDVTSSATVVNSNSIVLALDGATYLAAAQTLTISIQNGVLGSAVTKPLYVVTTPIINAVTNAASFVQTLTGHAKVSPYQMISIFGANFDTAGSPVASGTPDSEYFVYPSSLTNTATDSVKVTFYLTADDSKIADAPLIFVSPTQINAIVPAGISAHVGTSTVYVQVSRTDSGDDTVTNDSHNVVLVDVVAANPGIFTSGGSGQGAAAVLNADWSLNSSTNPALKGSIVHVYATGLGAPSSTGTDTYTATPAAYPGNCMSPTAYLNVLTGNGGALPPSAALGTEAGSALAGTMTSIDGALIASKYMYANVLPPCFAVTAAGIQAKFGTVTTAVTPRYAGFVTDAVAGLYQVDLTLPSAFTPAPPSAGGPVAMYLLANSVSSPAGVTIYVK